MPNVNQMFPSKWLSAPDIGQAKPVVTISNITFEQINQNEPQKMVLHFQGKNKGMVMNKTNAMNVAQIYGPETDAWIGKSVTLYTTFVDYQGKSTLALRIEPQAPQPVGRLAQPYVPSQQDNMTPDPNAPLASTMPEGPDDVDDEIPF